MKLIRYWLYRIMGLESYLKVVSKWYIILVKLGFFKTKHPEIHYLSEIIKPDDVCIDIGANLGYYSVFMSKLCGKNGKVLAVEPVPLFQKVWKKNTSKTTYSNLKLLPYALGEEDKEIKMGMPKLDGLIHHGMTKVINQDSEKQDFEVYFTVEMKQPDQLFIDEKKIDFIKMDIEGYEYFALKNMQATIQKFKPKVQMEISKHRDDIIALMSSMGYKVYGLKDGKLKTLNRTEIASHNKDFYFLQ